MKKLIFNKKTIDIFTIKSKESTFYLEKYKKLLLFFFLINSTLVGFCQVGINTENPRATLDVYGLSDNNSVPDGIIAPRLTEERLIAKKNSYTSEQEGAIIYITDTELSNYTADPSTESIINEGYYFYNGTKWLPLSSTSDNLKQNGAWKIQGSSENPTNQTDNIYQTGNVAIGTSAINPTNVQLNVEGNQSITGLLQIGGSSSSYINSAQLYLADEDKGILINKVSLQGRSIKDPVTDVVEGIMVYNTNTITSEGIVPGFYYWAGSNWMMLNQQYPSPSSNNLKNLNADCTSKAGNANTADQGTVLDFGQMIMTESGSYAFTLRLYGAVADSPPAGKAGFYYLALVVDDVIIDSVELDLIYPSQGSSSGSPVLSSTTTLMGVINAGQKVEIKLTNHTASPYAWTLKAIPDAGAKSANRTSMLWWKLS